MTFQNTPGLANEWLRQQWELILRDNWCLIGFMIYDDQTKEYY